MANKIYSGTQITISDITDSYFSADGYSVVSIEEVIKQIGYDKELPNVIKSPITIVPKGVQSAPGVVQDPAGSAIGLPVKPVNSGAGGGSQAIYKKFPDLEPIPQISEGSSVFNTSTGAGHRVLHTYSPNFGTMMLSKDKHEDRVKVVLDLANAYLNALLACEDAFKDASGLLHNVNDIGLTPISGKIFAGAFKDLGLDHLHPSYSIVAIMIAQSYLLQNGHSLFPISLYYYTGDSSLPFNEAQRIATELYN